MKNIKMLFLPLFLMLFHYSCQEDKSLQIQEENAKSSKSYLVFGHFYGFCQGESCIEIFKLTDSKLYEDTLDQYPGQEKYEGKYIGLDQSKFELVKDLPLSIPPQLLQEEQVVFGSPDVTDGGGIYLEYFSKGIHQYWIFDQIKENVPAYLHDFIDQVNHKIDLINQ